MKKATDAYIRSLKGSEKMREILIDQRLYLRVTLLKNGETKKKWFIRYYDAAGKQQRFTIGEYPALGLADARLKALQLTEQFKQGGTLAEQAKQKKSETTFAELTAEWLEKKSEGWVETHAIRQKERLGAVLRVFGEKDINQVNMNDITAAINFKIKQGAVETARRTISLIRQIFEFADTMGRLEDNRILIRIDSYRKTIAIPRRERHLYQELSEVQIGELLAKLELWTGRVRPETGTALKLASYLIVRPNELCGAKWDEIDLEKAEWVIPRERMKMSREHVVPLPTQVLSLLRELKGLTGNYEFIFPTYSKARTGESMRTETLVKALRKMGYTSHRSADGIFFTTHGFRGMASTILYQKLQFQGHLIELQLAHVDENKVRSAYNRIHSRSWLDERRKMLQAYADFLDNLKNEELRKRHGE